MAKHLLGDLKITDDAVAEWARGADGGRCPPDHLLGLRPGREHLIGLLVDSDHGGFEEDDALAADENDCVCRAKIDGEAAAQAAE